MGRRVLELLDGSRTLGDVVDTLSNEFQTEPGVLQADVFRFAAEIQRAGLGESVREENQ